MIKLDKQAKEIITATKEKSIIEENKRIKELNRQLIEENNKLKSKKSIVKKLMNTVYYCYMDTIEWSCITILFLILSVFFLNLTYEQMNNRFIQNTDSFKCLECNNTISINSILDNYCEYCGVEHNIDNVVVLKSGICDTCLEIIDTPYHSVDKGRRLSYDESKEEYVQAVREITNFKDYSELLDECKSTTYKLKGLILCLITSVFIGATIVSFMKLSIDCC